jgi:MscS family membrane protein
MKTFINNTFLFLIFIFVTINCNLLLAQEQSVTTEDTLNSLQPIYAESVNQLNSGISWSLTINNFAWLFIILLIAYISIKSLTRVMSILANKSKKNHILINRSIPIIKLIGWSTAIYLIFIAVLNPPIETFVAVTASIGIAFGLASQNFLKNIFGGVQILLDRPFQIGDKIEIGSHKGEVVQIGLRTVRILTANDTIVSIPNGEVVNHSVTNSNSGQSICQIAAEFYLPPDIDIQKVKKIAYHATATSRYVYLNKSISIIFKNEIHQGRSLLNMKIKAYVLDVRFEIPFASEITEIILQELLNQKLITADALTMNNNN